MEIDVLTAYGGRGQQRRIAIGGRWVWPARRGAVQLRRRRSPIRWIVAGGAVLILLDGAASLVLPPQREPAPPAVAVHATGPAAWQDIPNPLHLFTLSGSPLARLRLTYTARRTEAGDERQDDLSYGAFGGPAAYLHLAIRRRAEDSGAEADFVVDMARLAATDGLAVKRIGLPLNLATRFGLFDTADLTLGHGPDDAACLGFRLGAPGPVAMSGVVCGSDAEPLDRSALGCLLDRVDLVSAGDDTALRDVFVGAERRRGERCEPGRRRSAALLDGPTTSR